MASFGRAGRNRCSCFESHLSDFALEDSRQPAPQPGRTRDFHSSRFWLARSLRWTVATVFLLFLPAIFQVVFGVIKAIVEDKASVARDAVHAFLTTIITSTLTLTFLAHQTLLSLDAVVRAVVRKSFTRQRLLEWETAAEAELTTRMGPADRYLNWIPVLSIAVGALVWWIQPASLIVALPILALWACSKLVSIWLNRPTGVPRKELP